MYVAVEHIHEVERNRPVGLHQLPSPAREHLENSGINLREAHGVLFGGGAKFATPEVRGKVWGVINEAHRVISKVNEGRRHKVYSVNGGTASGLVEDAQRAAGMHNVLSIGVFPKGATVLGGGEEKLAPNDIGIAVKGKEFGDEREQIIKLASVGFYANGGGLTAHEVHEMLKKGGPVYLVHGSERFAGHAASMLMGGKVHEALRPMLAKIPGLEEKLRAAYGNGQVRIVLPGGEGRESRVVVQKGNREKRWLLRDILRRDLGRF